MGVLAEEDPEWFGPHITVAAQWRTFTALSPFLSILFCVQRVFTVARFWTLLTRKKHYEIS